MLSLLFPFFFSAICVTGTGHLSPPVLFGPFDTEEWAESGRQVMQQAFHCDTSEPYRYWRWTDANTIVVMHDQVVGVIFSHRETY